MSEHPIVRTARDGVPAALDGLIAVGAAGWVVATVFSQHPNRVFDWPRRFDKSGVAIPNWRFFAPNPATHDNRIAHRILFDDGSQTGWLETHVIPARSWRDPFYFPARRRDKAISDMCSSLIFQLVDKKADRIEKGVPYALLRSLARDAARAHRDPDGRLPVGFQFVVARDTGYDEGGEVEVVFASRFEPLDEQVSAAVDAAAEPAVESAVAP